MILLRAWLDFICYNLEAFCIVHCCIHSMIQGGALPSMCSRCLTSACANKGENDHKDMSVHTFGESAFSYGRVIQGGALLDALSRCLFLECLASLDCALRFASGVEPVCFFLRASAFCLVASRLCPCLWGPSFAQFK